MELTQHANSLFEIQWAVFNKVAASNESPCLKFSGLKFSGLCFAKSQLFMENFGGE